MPYEPLVLLHRLAPEDVNQLIRQNPPPPSIINQQDAQIFQKNEGSNIQSSEKDIVVSSISLPLENQQSTLQVLKANHIGINHEDSYEETLSKDQKHENSPLDCPEIKLADISHVPTDIFPKNLVVVIDDCFNNAFSDMVNSTAQHPKTRNPINSTVATNSNGSTSCNNSTVSTRDPAVVNEHINDTIKIMTTKSPLSSTSTLEETDKKTKEVSLLNEQHMVTKEPDKPINYEKFQQDSSGISLRTRTISSTTVPTSLHKTTDSSVTSVQSMCSSSTVSGPRPRGRPPRRKNLNPLANGKKLKQTTDKKVEESKVCDLTSTVIEREIASTSIDCVQKQNLTNQCNGINNYNDQENSNRIVTSVSVDTVNKHSRILPEINKNQECAFVDQVGKKKCGRKRKQSDVGEFVSKKRLLISENSKDSLVTKKKISMPNKSNMVVDLVKYGFLAGCDFVESYRHNTDTRAKTSTRRSYFYGRTYWPTNWEYSAAALTGHVPKKSSKDTLRKIRLICGEGASSKSGYTMSTSLKTNSTLKKYQTSVIQRRGSASKLSALSSVEVSSRHNSIISSTVVKRQKGRPPGSKNKLLQSVLKSNSPRKSPRQHASTLAAIMSNKVLGTDKLGAQQSDKLVDLDTSSNKNSLDLDGPCILTMAVPKHERMPAFRRHRHRRQLDRQHSITKRRRRRRSITPPPPKLCAQQPAPQRNPLNSAAVDQEVVKLRTKHVDVVRRRARDERLRAAFVCQQLHKVQESAEQNRRNLAQEIIQTFDENEQDYQSSNNTFILPLESSQDQIWSYLSDDTNPEPDNMCLQIMYEQTADKRFLCTNLSDETLQMYYQQRDFALAERLSNNHCGDNMSSDLGTDMISVGNKRKKKRPNMTGWPKEKRKKIMTSTTSPMITAINAINGDSDEEKNNILKRRRAAAALQQRLRRQRLKLEQQQLAKQNSKVKVVTATVPKRPGRPGRRPDPNKKSKTTMHHRTISVSSNGTTASSNNTSSTITTIKRKKITVKKQRKRRTTIQNKTLPSESVDVSTSESSTVVKRSCGRPRGSVGKRQRLKIKLLQGRRRNKTSLSSEQHKENFIQEQTSTGKLKCVISTRNNRVKLLTTGSNSSPRTSNQKKTVTGSRIKKSSAAYNLSSSCLTSLPSPVTVVGKTTRTTAKKKRLQQHHQQMATATVTWDAGRPKRYHSTNHGRNASGVAVEEDCCFVGSQPFEQHCPGVGGGLSHNTVLENQQDNQKENTVQVGG